MDISKVKMLYSIIKTERENGMRFQNIINGLKNAFSTGETIQVLTYETAMKYYKTDTPANSPVKKGILMREKLSNKTRIIQAFMDEENDIIGQPDHKTLAYGRQLLVESLDEELTELFGDASIVIVE